MRCFLLVLFFILLANAFSQTIPDSLIRKRDLIFSGPEEKAAFSGSNLTDPNNVIALLLISYNKGDIYNNVKAQQQIDECVAILKTEINGKPENKKVKIIYEHVHKKFLKVYKLQNSFTDIFTKGEYNCVSASALYAVIFTKLNIPFTAIEAPQHVYLVAYPETHKILIETTSPEKGYFQFSDNFIHQYVKSLYNAKLISKSEFESNSANQLFDKYYFNSKGLSLLDVVSLQYSNFSIYNLEEKKYRTGIEEIKKAYFLNPSDRNKYILKSALIFNVQNNKYDHKETINDLATLCRFRVTSDEELSNQFLKNEFIRVTENQLINNSDYKTYETSYNTISKEISDSVLMNEVSYVFHHELARVGYMNNMDSTFELPHLRAAYRINPKNANLQAIILGYLEREIKNKNEPGEIIKLLNINSKLFDFINDNSGFNGVKANCILELSYQSFAVNDVIKGENLLKEFESLMNTKKDANVNDNYIEKAYSYAAGIYYKKGNVTKARQTLKNGLLYSPENFGLKLRLNQL